MDEANKLAKELNECRKALKAAMFDNKLASFSVFPSIGEASLGELTYAHIQLPFKKVDFASTELKALDIRADYDFLLPLENGECIVAFKQFHNKRVTEYIYKGFMQMSHFNRLGRLIGTDTLESYVLQYNVVQCGPSEFAVCFDPASGSSILSVFNSNLTCLRDVVCKSFFNICCNSKFIFGLWNSNEDDGDDEDDDDNENSSQRIRGHHLDTLSKAFDLLVPQKYRIDRIIADEHHLVAVCRVSDEARQWYMTVFDLATCNQIGGKKKARFPLPERHIDLAIEWLLIEEVFLLDGWLVVPSDNEILWFDKEGKRSETSTELNNRELQTIYASRSVLLFLFHDGTLLMKR